MSQRLKKIVTATGSLAAAAVLIGIVVHGTLARSADSDPTELIPEKNYQEHRPARAASPAAVPSPGIDLLDPVDAPKDAIAGVWGFQDRALITSGVAWGRLQLPVGPPQENDLMFRVTRKRGVGSFNIGVVQDGRQGMIVIDGEDGRGSWISLSAVPDPENETLVLGKVLKWNRETRITVKVRRDGLAVSADGKTLIDWKGAASRLAFPAGWSVVHPKALFLGSWDSVFRIDEATLVPVTGSVSRVR